MLESKSSIRCTLYAGFQRPAALSANAGSYRARLSSYILMYCHKFHFEEFSAIAAARNSGIRRHVYPRVHGAKRATRQCLALSYGLYQIEHHLSHAFSTSRRRIIQHGTLSSSLSATSRLSATNPAETAFAIPQKVATIAQNKR